MTKAIRDHLRDFVALIGLFLVAGVVAVYVLDNQRMRFPIFEDAPFKLTAEMATAQAVTPGQGQTVRVSGVRIGDIGDVDLRDGRAYIRLDIDTKYRKLIHTDATAFLRPKTGLKDMYLEVQPGSHQAAVARENFTIPIHNTLPDVNPDEFLSALDHDTRDYLKLLLDGAGTGLQGRGADLRDVLRRFEPTYRDIARVTTAVAQRKRDLRRLVHSLNRLNTEVGSKDDDLAQLVDAAAKVFRAFASESTNITATVEELPSALRQTRTTLAKVDSMARVLGPASTRLRPAVRAMHRANQAVAPFAREAAPIIERKIRPFVREARPLVRDLRPAATDLVKAEPFLTRSFTVLNHFFNTLSFNTRGREGPENEARDEGYLFYLAWVAHQSVNVFSSGDAHGPFRPITTGGTCATLRGTAQSEEQIEFLLNLSGVLTDPRVCGGDPTGGILAAKRSGGKR